MQHLTVLSIVCLTSAAVAQVPPGRPNVSLERFLPAPGPGRILAIPTARTMDLLNFSVGLTIDYARSPLLVPGGAALVAHQLTGQLLGALGLGRLELGIALPVSLYQATDYAHPDFSAAALGDLRFHTKLRLTPARWKFGGAVEGNVSFPTGQGDRYSSEPGFGLAARAIADLSVGPVSLAGYLGYRYRTETAHLASIYLAGELLAGAGAAVALVNDRLDLFGEFWGSFGLQADPDVAGASSTIEQKPAEALFGLKLHLPIGLRAAVAAGPGLTAGYGSPTFRIVTEVSYARIAPDFDGDGIPNDLDRCPTEPEDKDGFEDEDGCPDPDNDKDGIIDTKDRCPDRPEDLDGFEDEDGCPDPDNDRDGLPDVRDKCPKEAEIYNGFEDEDGCPDVGPELVRVSDKRVEINETIYFDTDSDRIKPQSFKLLDTVARVVNLHAEIKRIQIAGHTDQRGTAEHNRKLSLERAISVMNFLVGRGNVDATRLTAQGFGFDQPIVPSAHTAADHERNRRVEFQILEKTK